MTRAVFRILVFVGATVALTLVSELVLISCAWAVMYAGELVHRDEGALLVLVPLAASCAASAWGGYHLGRHYRPGWLWGGLAGMLQVLYPLGCALATGRADIGDLRMSFLAASWHARIDALLLFSGIPPGLACWVAAHIGDVRKRRALEQPTGDRSPDQLPSA